MDRTGSSSGGVGVGEAGEAVTVSVGDDTGPNRSATATTTAAAAGVGKVKGAGTTAAPKGVPTAAVTAPGDGDLADLAGMPKRDVTRLAKQLEATYEAQACSSPEASGPTPACAALKQQVGVLLLQLLAPCVSPPPLLASSFSLLASNASRFLLLVSCFYVQLLDSRFLG